MSPSKKNNPLSTQGTRARVAAGAAVAIALLLVAVGVFTNLGLLSMGFDPSSFLGNSLNAQNKLNEGDDSTFASEDNETGDEADVQGEGNQDEQTSQAATPEEGQSAGVSSAQVVDGDSAGGAVTVAGGDGTAGSGTQTPGDTTAPDNGGGNNGGGASTPTVDPDRPSTPTKPAVMNGVSVLSLKPSGMAVFSTVDEKGSISPEQNLANVTVTVVLYDESSGTKWTRTLTYGDIDGQTYTVPSDAFPMEPGVHVLKVYYYLYGERYETEIPCVVGDDLTAEADAQFFDHLNVDQNVSADDLANYLHVELSGTPIDTSLCSIEGFDTSQAAGSYEATITYAGLSATFDYTVNEVGITLHTPQALVDCTPRMWGTMDSWFFSASMMTQFNGTESLRVTLDSSSFDLTSYARQLLGDLYWTQLPEWSIANDYGLWEGPDPAFSTQYVIPGTNGRLNDWFVGWATADPAQEGAPVDSAWLEAHLLDTQLSAADIAQIAAEQGTGGSIDLYPVMRSDTTISADAFDVRYNEHALDWLYSGDTLENRAPAQILAGFASDAVVNGELDVPEGVTYITLSPYMTESGCDESALQSVEYIHLPIGLQALDQTYPFYGHPYYSSEAGRFASAVVVPNLQNFAQGAVAAGHGGSAYRTCAFTVEHKDGSTETIYGLVDGEDTLTMLPSKDVCETDKVIMDEGAGVRSIQAVAINGMHADTIEFASSVEQIEEGAARSSTFNTIIVNSAPRLYMKAFSEISEGDEPAEGTCGFTSLVFRTTDVPTLQPSAWDPFLVEGENTFANLQANNIHIYLPDVETLIRCYSAWANDIDLSYATYDDDWNLVKQPVAAYLLRVEGENVEQPIYYDDKNVVYLRGDDGDTLLYAPADLTGYYEIPENVAAIAEGAFADCMSLAGVIVNPRTDGKLPQLGEYAFGRPDDTGYAAPPDTLKIYVSNALEGEETWQQALKEQYWHTSDQEQAANADKLVDLVFESDYESYETYNSSLYATTGEANEESGDDCLALLRANESQKGLFVLLDNVVKIESFAFAGCEHITAVVNTSWLEEIGDTAFLDCKLLNVVVLPETLKSVGDCAFLGCLHLEALAFNSVPELGDDLFDQANIPRVFLPSSACATDQERQAVQDSLASDGIQVFEECAYEGGSYGMLQSDNYSYSGISVYRGLCTISADGSEKQVSFAGSNLGDPDWGDYSWAGDKGLSIDMDSQITEIADGVFADQPYLTALSGGKSVTKIGDGAFKNCASLSDFSLGEWNSTVEWIGDDAFNGCTMLGTFIMPGSGTDCASGVFHVGDRAFMGCENLLVTRFSLDPTDRFMLPDGVKVELGEQAFSGCSSIMSVALPSGDVIIGERAFEGCENIAAVTSSSDRSDSALVVGEDAFCDSPITFISMPGSPESVASGAFASAEQISVLFMAEDATVAPDAFPAGASVMHAIGPCPDGIDAAMTYDAAGVDGVISTMSSQYGWENDTFVAFSYPADETSNVRSILFAGDDMIDFVASNLPQGNYVLADGAFEGSEALQSASLDQYYGYGGQIVSIGARAFKDCVSLTNTGMGMNSSVSEIGASAYEGCTSLTSVDISMYTTKIGDCAFKGCTSLTDVSHWWATDARCSDCTLGASAFEGCASLEYYMAPGYLQEIGSDCFKGCDIMELWVPWMGDMSDPSTVSLPKLDAHPFGTNADGTAFIPGKDRLKIYYENALGGAVDTTEEELVVLMTAGNGWLSFKDSFTYVSQAEMEGSGDASGFDSGDGGDEGEGDIDIPAIPDLPVDEVLMEEGDGAADAVAGDGAAVGEEAQEAPADSGDASAAGSAVDSGDVPESTIAPAPEPEPEPASEVVREQEAAA